MVGRPASPDSGSGRTPVLAPPPPVALMPSPVKAALAGRRSDQSRPLGATRAS